MPTLEDHSDPQSFGMGRPFWVNSCCQLSSWISTPYFSAAARMRFQAWSRYLLVTPLI